VRENEASAHPWMANSVADLKRRMLEAVGASSIEELFHQIPEDHRFRGELRLPPSLRSEPELKRHLVRTLSKNATCEETLSFLGAGVWQHHVPAICDTVYGRTEWLTSVFGGPSSDHGRNQAWFEFGAQLGELVDMEFVGLPVYSWGCAIGHAIRMAARMTGRRKVVLAGAMDPERLSVVRTYCEPRETATHIAIVHVPHDPRTGLVDMAALKAAVGTDVAAVYFETPGYNGMIEPRAAEIAALARAAGAETIAGCDPIALGVLAPPGSFGADIAVGPTQPLGVHMNCGGGVGGYIASRDEERYAREYPTLNVSIAPTADGKHGFGLSLFHQSSYGMREEGKDWTGNSVYMWAVANAVYMSLLGPQGFREVGGLILQRAHYAAGRLAAVRGVRVPHPTGFFKEFLVDFAGAGRTVAEINRALRDHGIFGGKDVSAEGFGPMALYCVTEIHTKDDIDRLATALEEICR